MRTTACSSFGAVCHAELLFNARRVAPYALGALFAANAVFWWALGPAVSRGWATNSDFFIVRMFGGFTFMTLPLFVALMMGDPVIRDFDVGIDPLLFSKPLRRAEYLLGKFLGNFAVLVACQACFAVTLLLLQAFGTSGMIVLPARALPYLEHFFVLVVVSTLLLAAVCFAVGTLTRNVKIVYALMASFYFVYAAYQISLKGLSLHWRIVLDPLLFNIDAAIDQRAPAQWINHVVIGYDAGTIANRVVVVLASALCLTIVHLRFSIAPTPASRRVRDVFTPIAFARAADEHRVVRVVVAQPSGALRALYQLTAAIGIELRLLMAERSVVVIAPLSALAAVVGLAYYPVISTVSLSAEYAARSVQPLVLILCAAGVFFTVEAMFRDREVGVEPVLWSMPIPSSVLLVPKCVASLLVVCGIALLVACASGGIQAYKGHAPIAIGEYSTIYAMVLIPTVAVAIATASALSVVARDKYLAYAIAFGLGGALYYLYGQGHTSWWYNPALVGRWTPADFVGSRSHVGDLLPQRAYWLVVSAALIGLAHARYPRR